MKNRHNDAPGKNMVNQDGFWAHKCIITVVVYITATASERIVDKLEFSPHNSPMPQMSSTDRVLMAAQDMTDALKHPHIKTPIPNKIPNLRSPGIAQRATTSEGGHTGNTECSTSEGANRGVSTFSAKFVARFLGHGWS
jgi:hypothetical protein